LKAVKKQSHENKLTGHPSLLLVGSLVFAFSVGLLYAEPQGRPALDVQALLDDLDDKEHQFEAPTDPLSLSRKLEVQTEQTIIEQDERLKARLENAITSQIEPELIKFVDMDIGSHYKRTVLLTLGEIYEKQGSPSRLIALYEKFGMEFPRDRDLPKIFLKLGRMYREAGAHNTALGKFYNVLNVALNVPVDELKEYQEVSHRAQLEIAETFFAMGAYDQAAKFFKRLLRVDLMAEDKQNVLFKYAYTIYLSGSFQEAISSMRSFIHTFPDSELAAEARFLLAETYTRLNDPKSAMRETLELLSQEITKINTHPEAWLYWKKRTGNQLANRFYEVGNYMDALIIYQAMVQVSEEPSWRWPVLYQVGLCYERLSMKPKAIEAYQGIVESAKTEANASESDFTLVSIKEMAQWRLDRLDLDLDMEFNLQRILNNAG
jgi:tetratricopeptide (TPR) repeat protein